MQFFVIGKKIFIFAEIMNKPMNNKVRLMRRLLTALCLLTVTAQAQQFTMMPLPRQNKLPHSEVYRIMEDSEGYVWYATREAGLCRDNGYQVDVFRNDRHQPDLLRSNAVRCIAENREAREIWFGTKQGAYVLSKRDYSIRQLPGVSNHVHAIAQSDDGMMWVGANKQVKVYSAKGEPVDSFALSWKGRPMNVETMLLDSHGTLWISQWDGGVQTIDTRSRQLKTMNWDEAVGPTSMAEDTLNHHYYVGTWGEGLFRYDGQTAVPLAPELQSPMQRKVRSVHYDGHRQLLWVVTMAGLYIYHIEGDGQLSPYPVSSLGLPPEQAVYALCFDRYGNVWVPGSSPLTFILRPTKGKWMHRTSLSPLTRQAGVRVPIAALVSDGRYHWIWSDRTQLMVYDQQEERYALVTGKPDEGSARFGDVMTRRKAGGLWCATGRKVYACNQQDMRVSLTDRPVVELPEQVTAIAEGDNGSLYIGASSCLYRYEFATDSLHEIASDLRTVRAVVVGEAGRVFFISTRHGICMSDGKQGFTSLVPYKRHTSMAWSTKGQLWVGNAFGDVWLVDSTAHYKPVASNRESNGVKQMVCDSLGHLWVMGDTYLTEYDPQGDRRRLFFSSQPSISLDNFGGISLTERGQVIVAGGGGIVCFEPKAISSGVEESLPQVAAYEIDGQKRLISSIISSIDVPADAVTLTLELTHFNFLKSDEEQFAYRLEGMSNNWIELPMGENRLSLVNLSKGDYTLEIKVCDSYGHWGEPVKVLTICRQPAWWETWTAYLCYVLLAVGLIAWAVSRYLKRSKEKTRRQMDEQLTEMKMRFFTNVSHELRTPLSLIITPLESIVKNGGQREESSLKNILKHAYELLDLVNRLLDFRKMDMGEMKLHPAQGELLGFLRTCAATFQPMAEKKGIELEILIPEGTLYTAFDARAMQHVMYNLLSNAMKFTEKGCVTVAVKNDKNELVLTISDTGTGIDPEELPHVFDRYYQARNADDTSVAGSGIGLNMVKEIVEMAGGRISVASEQGKGSVFTVVLPIEQVEAEGELSVSPVIPKLPSILIADDNDDFREFLVHELKADYNILQARNGKEALRLAQTNYVDVILSDVMMPQMDGNELCRQLKNDPSTSHIYIILLTAKTAEESRLEGYESGADYYLTKPFNLDLLKNRLSRMSQLQEERIVMMSKAEQQEQTATEEELHLSPVDRKFMNKLHEVMEKYVADNEFGVDEFCAEMGLSRTNLYRRMNTLVGKSPAQYINDYRLELADRLLHEGELNVTEIADRTGFSTASYFSKCYKAKYGKVPKNVRLK